MNATMCPWRPRAHPRSNFAGCCTVCTLLPPSLALLAFSSQVPPHLRPYLTPPLPQSAFRPFSVIHPSPLSLPTTLATPPVASYTTRRRPPAHHPAVTPTYASSPRPFAPRRIDPVSAPTVSNADSRCARYNALSSPRVVRESFKTTENISTTSIRSLSNIPHHAWNPSHEGDQGWVQCPGAHCPSL